MEQKQTIINSSVLALLSGKSGKHGNVKSINMLAKMGKKLKQQQKKFKTGSQWQADTNNHHKHA